MSKVALITGVTGQDGSYLAELLLEKGYKVHGIKRRASSLNSSRVDHIYQGHDGDHRTFVMHYCDMTDNSALTNLIQKIQPDEIYNLAAQSHVKVSFEIPEYTANADALGPLRILEAIRTLGLIDKTKFYQASTSEMYGGVKANMPEAGYNENSYFYPRSPYGAAKLFGHWITVNYRESYGIFACSGILFNHESPRRGETFVTRKITRAIAQIYHGLADNFQIGNLDAYRDRGHAKNYVEAMWLMLQQDTPKDYVIATGRIMTVRQFIEMCFQEVGIEIERKGSGLEEKGYNKANGKVLVEVSEKYFRPAEVDVLLGDSSLARQDLGWNPDIELETMVKEMLNHDIESYKRSKHLLDNGFALVKRIDL